MIFPGSVNDYQTSVPGERVFTGQPDAPGATVDYDYRRLYRVPHTLMPLETVQRYESGEPAPAPKKAGLLLPLAIAALLIGG